MLLGTPLVLPCGLRVPNRIAKASMTERLSSPDGAPTPELARLSSRFASGGAGLLLTGNVVVDARHLEAHGNAVLEDERHLAAFSRWAEAGRGVPIVAQLNHPGRQAMRTVSNHPVAPSAVGLRVAGAFARPRALAADEVEDVIARFVRSARLAEAAGFAGVQIHAAHGYLLSQFLSPRVNRRADRWGGSLENRARALLTIVERIRGAVSPAFAVGVKLNAGDFVRGGLEPEESTRIVGWLDRLGIDFLEVSGGTFERPASFGYGVGERTRAREAYFLDLAARARQATSVPLMVTGGFRSARAMEDALVSGACDLIGLARPLAAEPDLPRRLLNGQAERAIDLRLSLPPGPAAALAELAWHLEQLERMGDGDEPRLDRSPWLALARGLARDLRAGWRRQVCARPTGALSAAT
jgi:2,4-dienoyl-CoA reductase-like NADH-dependent reductase (Old Yellow Enzyme family)